jgi:hypothetical protein
VIYPGYSPFAVYRHLVFREDEHYIQPCIDRKVISGFDKYTAGAQVNGIVGEKLFGFFAVTDAQAGDETRGCSEADIQIFFGYSHEIMAVDRLDDDIVATRLPTPFEILFIHPFGYHYHGNFTQLLIRLDYLATFVAIHVRHIEIHEDQVRPFFSDDSERLIAAVGQQQIELPTVKKSFFLFQEKMDIVNQQYLFFLQGQASVEFG